MKKRVLLGGCLIGVFAAASALAARPDYWKPNYDKSKIAPYTLEDPLTFVDGTKVASPADWARRRCEILGIFAKEMFGQEPPAPEAVVVEKVEEGVTLAGFGIRRQYRMWFKADKSGPAIDWLVLLPRWAKKPALPIIFLNYGGNYELIRDKQVVTPDMWIALRPAHKCVEELRGRYEDMLCAGLARREPPRRRLSAQWNTFAVDGRVRPLAEARPRARRQHHLHRRLGVGALARTRPRLQDSRT